METNHRFCHLINAAFDIISAWNILAIKLLVYKSNANEIEEKKHVRVSPDVITITMQFYFAISFQHLQFNYTVVQPWQLKIEHYQAR